MFEALEKELSNTLNSFEGDSVVGLDKAEVQGILLNSLVKLEIIISKALDNDNNKNLIVLHAYYPSILGTIFGTFTSKGWLHYFDQLYHAKDPSHLKLEAVPMAQEKVVIEKLQSLLSVLLEKLSMQLNTIKTFFYEIDTKHFPSCKDPKLLKKTVWLKTKVSENNPTILLSATEYYLFNLIYFFKFLDNDAMSIEEKKDPNKNTIYFEQVINDIVYFKKFVKEDNSGDGDVSFSTMAREESSYYLLILCEFVSEAWLRVDENNHVTMLVPSTISPGSEEKTMGHIKLIYIVLNYLVYDGRCLESIAEDKGDTTDILKLNFVYMTTKIYHFFEQYFSSESIGHDFLLVLETFLLFIKPWTTDADKHLWKNYIIDNFLFYQEITAIIFHRVFEAELRSLTFGRTAINLELEKLLKQIIDVLASGEFKNLLRELSYSLSEKVPALVFSYYPSYAPIARFRNEDVITSDYDKEQLSIALDRQLKKLVPEDFRTTNLFITQEPSLHAEIYFQLKRQMDHLTHNLPPPALGDPEPSELPPVSIVTMASNWIRGLTHPKEFFSNDFRLSSSSYFEILASMRKLFGEPIREIPKKPVPSRPTAPSGPNLHLLTPTFLPLEEQSMHHMPGTWVE